MTRYFAGLVLALALGVMGCSETAGTGGSGGDGGAGGDGGTGGTDLCEGVDCDDGNECTEDACDDGVCDNPAVADAAECDFDGLPGLCMSGVCEDAMLCEGVTCEDTECKIDGACDASDGMCDFTLAEDGTVCSEGECLDGVCAPVGAFPCTEQGIRDAIAVGGGPHFFACDGPTTVVTEAEIAIDNDVILDGRGDLTVDGDEDHRVFSVSEAVTTELHGFGVTGGGVGCDDGAGISNAGALTLTDSSVFGNAARGRSWDECGDHCCGSAGGGLYNFGSLELTNTTVSGNSAGNGGGGIVNSGTIVLTNSTVSGNAAGYYPAIWNEGTARLYNTTVSANIHIPGWLPSGDIHNGRKELTLTNSLVHDECDGDITSNGYNIESPGDTCGFDQPTDQVNVSADDLKLGELADNGGPTMTHALGAGSVAIDVIPAVDCVDADGEPLTQDQRGEPRPETGGSMCDVGAFEVQP